MIVFIQPQNSILDLLDTFPELPEAFIDRFFSIELKKHHLKEDDLTRDQLDEINQKLATLNETNQQLKFAADQLLVYYLFVHNQTNDPNLYNTALSTWKDIEHNETLTRELAKYFWNKFFLTCPEFVIRNESFLEAIRIVQPIKRLEYYLNKNFPKDQICIIEDITDCRIDVLDYLLLKNLDQELIEPFSIDHLSNIVNNLGSSKTDSLFIEAFIKLLVFFLTQEDQVSEALKHSNTTMLTEIFSILSSTNIQMTIDRFLDLQLSKTHLLPLTNKINQLFGSTEVVRLQLEILTILNDKLLNEKDISTRELLPNILNLKNIYNNELLAVWESIEDRSLDIFFNEKNLPEVFTYLIAQTKNSEFNPNNSDFFVKFIDEVLFYLAQNPEQTALPIIYLWLDSYASNLLNVQEYLEELSLLLNWGLQSESNLYSLFTLNNHIFNDINYHSQWIEILLETFCYVFNPGIQEQQKIRNKELFLHSFFASQQFRTYIHKLNPVFTIIKRNKFVSDKMAKLFLYALNPESEKISEPFHNYEEAAFYKAIELQTDNFELVFQELSRKSDFSSLDRYNLGKFLGLDEVQLTESFLHSLLFTEYKENPSLGLEIWAEHINKTCRNQIITSLIKRIPMDFTREHKESLKAIGLFFLLIQEQGEINLPDGQVNLIASHASKKLHELRIMYRERSPNFNQWCSMSYMCGFIVAKSFNLFRAMKPLFLLIRELQEPSVNSALQPLRYAIGDLTVHKIPETITILLHKSSDDKLQDCRRDIALDFLNKLKPAKNREISLENKSGNRELEGYSSNITEPSPIWRNAYLHGLKDLGIKQTGKGHFITGVLKKVSETDPSSMVRESANQAYNSLNNLRTGWTTGSHKRLIFHAWWWIRQAHRIEIGETIDEVQANKTRNIEFR